jgi:hypothetical protein
LLEAIPLAVFKREARMRVWHAGRETWEGETGDEDLEP